jgi:hypothetical protein
MVCTLPDHTILRHKGTQYYAKYGMLMVGEASSIDSDDSCLLTTRHKEDLTK